jgi:hypothetical protein
LIESSALHDRAEQKRSLSGDLLALPSPRAEIDTVLAVGVAGVR